MIRLIALAAFALVLATSAQAMPRVPLQQPDGLTTQVRYYGYRHQSAIGTTAIGTTAIGTTATTAGIGTTAIGLITATAIGTTAIGLITADGYRHYGYGYRPYGYGAARELPAAISAEVCAGTGSETPTEPGGLTSPGRFSSAPYRRPDADNQPRL